MRRMANKHTLSAFVLFAFIASANGATALPRDCEAWRETWSRSKRLPEEEVLIDADGPGGQQPFKVRCDMTTRPATTIVSHNYQGKVENVKAASRADAKFFLVEYGATMGQIVALMAIEDQCSQHLRYECHHSLSSANGVMWSHWYSRRGHKMPYFPGGEKRGIGCACAFDRSCVGGTSHLCNCEKNDNHWRSDEGSVTDKDLLPITNVTFADTDHDTERGFFTLGPLRCIAKQNAIRTNNYTTAFLVTRTSPFGPAPTRTTVQWENILTNLGSAWRQDTSQFVTGTPGLYAFHISAATGDSSKPLYLYILKNSAEVMRVFAPPRPVASASTHFALHLNSGDIIKVQIEANHVMYSDSNVRSHFSGYLVTPRF